MSYIKQAADQGIRQAQEYLKNGGVPGRKAAPAGQKPEAPARKKGWLGKLFGK